MTWALAPERSSLASIYATNSICCRSNPHLRQLRRVRSQESSQSVRAPGPRIVEKQSCPPRRRHIELANIRAWLQNCERNVELNRYGIAAFHVDSLGLHHRRLVNLGRSLDQFQAAQQVDSRLCPLWLVLSGLLARRPVHLVKQVKVLVLAEDVADIRHVFLAFAHQRRGFLARLPQRGQHDGAHLQRLLLHVGKRDVRFKRAHAARLVLAYDKL